MGIELHPKYKNAQKSQSMVPKRLKNSRQTGNNPNLSWQRIQGKQDKKTTSTQKGIMLPMRFGGLVKKIANSGCTHHQIDLIL